MKLKLRFLFLSFIIGVTGNVFAQDNYFTVLAAQGDILFQKTGETKMVDIRTGNNINPGEQINVWQECLYQPGILKRDVN